MVTDINDLEAALEELGGEFVDAAEAQKRSVAAEVPLAKNTLKKVVREINDTVSGTGRNLISKISMPVDSPTISFVVSALRQRNYLVEIKGAGTYTHLHISW